MAVRGIYELVNINTGAMVSNFCTLKDIAEQLSCKYSTVRNAAANGTILEGQFKVRTMEQFVERETPSYEPCSSNSEFVESWNRVMKGAALIRQGAGKIVIINGKKYVTRKKVQ